ncbi:MAG: hypothetical protein C4324_00550 [Blastocatellia bacterium]
MKKSVWFGLMILVSVVSSFSQEDRTTRPRVAATPKPPIINGGTSSPQAPPRSSAPVLGGKSQPVPSPTPPPAAIGSDEEIRVETNLVTIPVSVLDRNGRFVSDLQKNDFQILENGIQQKVEYFQTVEQPFTVVLLIDVSPSTQFRIDEIQDAAIDFVNQLRPNDRVMVIAFDERVHTLTEPTNNRVRLRQAIRQARFGDGTSLYEAVDYSLNRVLRTIAGRKAIVIFTDGVDTTSRRASYQSTVEDSEESDALIYPIRFNTQRDAWARGGGSVGLPPRQAGGVLGAIIGIIVGGQMPTIGGGTGPAGSSPQEYALGKRYLEEIAQKSGGRNFEADTTRDLNAAFSGIAEELRRQYSIGYYPDNPGKPGERRQIRVRVLRAGLVVKAKSSYVYGSSSSTFAGK